MGVGVRSGMGRDGVRGGDEKWDGEEMAVVRGTMMSHPFQNTV